MGMSGQQKREKVNFNGWNSLIDASKDVSLEHAIL